MSEEFIPNLDDLIDVLPLTRGSEVSAIPTVPDASDISEPPVGEDSALEPVEGLTLLKPSERPMKGQHFVVWGSVLLNDIRERPVRKGKVVSEDKYAEKMAQEARQIVAGGVKNPRVRTDPVTRKALLDSEEGGETWDRIRRAEEYARWRYRGFVCGEVYSL